MASYTARPCVEGNEGHTPRPHIDSAEPKNNEDEVSAETYSLEPTRTLGERIYGNLISGEYECPICTEFIPAEGQMWSCKNCYHVYHFGCVNTWSKNSGIWRWPCPTCKKSVNGAPTATCWCEKMAHGSLNTTGNTCGQICSSIQKCKSPGLKCIALCEMPCHPGPCEPVVCSIGCPMREVKIPSRTVLRPQTPVVPALSVPPARRTAARGPGRLAGSSNRSRIPRQGRPPNWRSRLRQRWRDLDGKTFKMAVWCCTALAFFGSLFLLWACRHVQWLRRPLEHTTFTEKYQNIEFVFVVLTAIIANIVVIAIPAFLGLVSLYVISVSLFALPSPGFRRFLLALILLAFGIVVSLFFIVVTAAGPGLAWYNQMRRSCEGFDTRIKLDTKKDDFYYPSDSFSLYNPEKQDEHSISDLETFNITRTVEYRMPPNKAFYSFYRVFGTLSLDLHLVVDYDIRHYSWRMMTVVYGINTTIPTESTPLPLTQDTPIRNGTWSDTSLTRPHMILPELNLQIPDMYYFTRKSNYQPFMKVFRTDNMSEQAIKEQSMKEWSPQSESNVVMRTASFGHSINGLEVCAKRADYQVKEKAGKIVTGKGLKEDIIIPLGLLAVLRKQMESDGKLDPDCSLL